MLNSILNGDRSNSVPGRQFPKGLECPFGICLPGTELLQSPFWTEFIAWDQFRSDITDPCGIIADLCVVIADPCGNIVYPCSVVTIPKAIGGSAVGDADHCLNH